MSNISNEWKQALTVEDYQYFCETVSLYDLAFYELNKTTYARDISHGLHLSHSVIVYNYNDDEKNPTSAIRLALPDIDIRTKPLFLTPDNCSIHLDFMSSEFKKLIESLKIEKLKSGDLFFNKQYGNFCPGIKIFDKEAILKYSNTDSFLKKELNDFSDVKQSINNEDSLTCIILAENNSIFKNKYLKDYENLLAFNGLYLSFESTIFERLFKGYFHVQGDFYVSNFIEPKANNVIEIDDAIKYLLKNCYVNILCAFYADIIDYKDFGQSLTPESNVVHRNLILSGTADWHKFDKFSDDKVDDTKTSRPYIPSTTPLVDNIANAIGNNNEVLEYISNEENLKNFGSLQTETFESNEGEDAPFTSSAFSDDKPPLYFDKNSRNTKKDYIDAPIIIPKDGNFLIDGRIFSVTIDEIWEAIKRIEFGRKPDTDISDSTEVGYPYAKDAKYKTSKDSRPVAAKKFNLGNGSIGDPLKIKYNKEDDPLTFEVESFVNDPDTIYYNVIDEVKSLLTNDLSLDEDTVSNFDDILSLIGNVSKSLPNDKAYSLRELESLLRGLQFNIAYFIRYSERYFTRVGKLGKNGKGSLYQLHKDFVNDNEHDTSFIDSSSLNKITENTNDDSANDVFMSAAGTWQKVSQVMKLRVRTDEEF